MFTDDGRDAIQFGRGESVVVLHSNGRQPELCKLAVSLYVNMGRLVSVAGEEEKPIRATLKDGRTHRNDSANFSDSPPILIDGPVAPATEPQRSRNRCVGQRQRAVCPAPAVKEFPVRETQDSPLLATVRAGWERLMVRIAIRNQR